MFKKFSRWLIIWIVSFIIQLLGIANQGVAFFWLDVGGIVLILILLLLIGVLGTKSFIAKIAATLGVGFITICIFGFSLFLTWLISFLFNIDFFITYQVVTFIQCLFKNKQQNQY